MSLKLIEVVMLHNRLVKYFDKKRGLYYIKRGVSKVLQTMRNSLEYV